MSVAERLKEERERTGLSQEAFGAVGGVKKLTQFNYESGKRSPDAEYLGAISKISVDVTYIVTGIRSASSLDDNERILLNSYRAAPNALKNAALGVLLSAQQPPPTSVKQKVNASGVVQIGGNNSWEISNDTKGRKRK